MTKPIAPKTTRHSPPLVRRKRTYRSGVRRHNGPVIDLGDERFCGKCGIGVDGRGLFERAVNNYGARITAAAALQLSGHTREVQDGS